MTGIIVDAAGQSRPAETATVQELLGRGEFFWLDLGELDEEGLALLRDTFHFHPLAVEDAEQFGQRPKLDVYDDFALLVAYAAASTTKLVELHCFYSTRCLVTVHRADCPCLADLPERLARLGGLPADPLLVLHRVVDAVVDTYFPLLDAFDDDIDALEDDILARPSEAQLGRLFDLKRELVTLRRVITPMRDVFATIFGGRGPIPGMTAETERYFRDVYDHLIRLNDLVDTYRDLLSGGMDTYLSTVSNRLNAVMKQLTIIATVFLPLTFITGFFGQNFAWMVDRIGGLPEFLGLGIGLQVVTGAALLLLFQRRGWIGASAGS